MDDGSPICGLILFFISIIMNIILYGFSAAVQSINEQSLLKRCEEGSKKAIRILHITQNPVKYVNTVQTVTFLADLILGLIVLRIYGELSAGWMLETFYKGNFNQGIYIMAYVITALIILFIVLSLGIQIPKRIGGRYQEGWAYGLVNIISLLTVLFTPITFVINLITGFVLKLFQMDLKEPVEEVTEEEIMSMINEGHEQGTILASEAEMITNIFELADTEASDVMTHRKNISAVNGEWTLEETVKYILAESYSRFPVYVESIDNIIGILHLKDAVIAHEAAGLKNKIIGEIPNLLRTAHFIPETRKLDLLLKHMQSGKIHMEIVVDEYGQTAGLVAMEDIIEEIVGNIFDEYDKEENNIILQEDGTYLIKGSADLEDVEEVLEIQLGEHDYDTLNGFLISKLDRIPGNEDKPDIFVEGVHYEILQVENKMISLVRVTLPVKEPSQEDMGQIEKEEH